jgi:hypothetical protein
MALAFQSYTAEGILQAHALIEGRLADALEAGEPLFLELGRLTPLEPGPARAFTSARVEVDDLLVVVTPPGQVVPSHAVWHPLELRLGPWRVRGRLPALPGFDPGRALARPGGTFVLLGEVTVAPAETMDGAPEEGHPADHDLAWINRYGVETVEAELDLGHFFPGASQERRPAAG